MSASLISSVVFSTFIFCRVYDLQLGVACSLTLLVVLTAASTGWSFMAVVSLHLSFMVFSVVFYCLESLPEKCCDRQTDRQAGRQRHSFR